MVEAYIGDCLRKTLLRFHGGFAYEKFPQIFHHRNAKIHPPKKCSYGDGLSHNWLTPNQPLTITWLPKIRHLTWPSDTYERINDKDQPKLPWLEASL